MKKLFLSFLALLCCGITAYAVPARPGWHTIKQSDGTTLTVQGVGNAFNSAILTRDGLTVARGADGDFYYISSLTGLTSVRAHDAQDRSASEVAFINVQRDQFKMVKKQRLNRSTARFNAPKRVGGSNADSGVPAMGSRRIPIILVEFKDKKFNNTREDIIDAMLTGNESVGQYFRDQSNGLYQPEFDVYGIYGLSRNREYYGGHSGDDVDKGLGTMVTEAVQLAAAAGVSFKTYDTNNDDYCDVVIVIYAGVGEAQAVASHPEAIWPCNWNLSSASYYSQGGNGAFRPSNGDPMVDNFAVFNELYGDNDNGKTIDGIGTFTHEFGHCLGLPDFYDTGDGGHYGLGDWDIMCMGCYNNDGFTPPGYSAYEKVFMGWVDYVTPQPGTYYTLPVWNQKQQSTDKAVCIKSDINENEFFILENRKKQGWDRYMPGQGIMITHVTYSADRWWYNTPNNEDIQLMTLMNADNTWSYYNESTDLWPQGNKRDFTNNSTPAAKLNMTANGNITGNAGYLGKPVTEMVINNDGTASFWYMKGAATRPVISVSTTEIDLGAVMLNNSATKSFNLIAQALTGDVTLTLNDPNGVFSVNPAVISSADAANGLNVTVTFSPAAVTSYSATITLSSPGADNVIINLTGRGQIEGYTPVMQPVDSTYINLTQFRADWTDNTPDQNVLSYTLEVSTKPSVVLLENADFSTVPDAISGDYLADISGNTSGYLPDGWSGTSFLGAYGGSLISAFGGTIMSPTYDFSGYDKMTVVVKACDYYQEGNCPLWVSSSMGYQELSLSENYEDYIVVLDCAQNDNVTLRSGDDNVASVSQVQIYAGDLTTQPRNAVETGNTTYRLITDITDKFYLVKNLEEAGTFVYKVKAHYIDGTESPWSNVEEVTLYYNEHSYACGDVNHDDSVDIEDVTSLIAMVLGTNGNGCPICANVDQEGAIDINDITALISIVLGN